MSATRDGLSLIAVIMHSPSSDIRFSEAQKLLNYGFSNFTNISFGNKGDVIGKVSIQKGVLSEINAIMEDDSTLFIEKAKSSKVVQNISLNDRIEAPIEKGSVIGEITYSLDDKIIKKVNLVASETVSKLTLVNLTTTLYDTWFKLLR